MEERPFDIRQETSIFSNKGRYSSQKYRSLLGKIFIVLGVGLIILAILKFTNYELFKLFGYLIILPLYFISAYFFIVFSIKRLHDMTMTGIILIPMIALIIFIPFIGVLALFILLYVPGVKGNNMFGVDPLENNRYKDKSNKLLNDFISDSYVKVDTNKKNSVAENGSGSPKYNRVYNLKTDKAGNTTKNTKISGYGESKERDIKKKLEKYKKVQNELLEIWDRKLDQKRKPYVAKDIIYPKKSKVSKGDMTEFQKMKKKMENRAENKRKTIDNFTRDRVQKVYILKFNNILDKVRRQKEQSINKSTFRTSESVGVIGLTSVVNYGEKLEKTDNYSYSPNWNNSLDILHKSNKESIIDLDSFSKKNIEDNSENNGKKESKLKYTDEIIEQKTLLKKSKKLGNYKIFDGYAYFKDLKIYGADIDSFDYIGVNYAKDKNSIYYQDRKIYGLDINTFGVFYGEFMEDKNNIYFRQNKIYGLDRITAKALGNGYIRDKNTVYYQNRKVYGVDLDTFQVLEEGKAEDKDYRYEGTIKLSK